MGERKALIIANDQYDQESLPNLASPAADAESLSRVLGDPQIGDFNVRIARNEPSYQIAAHIEDLLADCRPDDLLLLHFSGHGLKSDSGELFFAAPNTRPDRLGSTAVAAAFVQGCLLDSRARQVVLLLDCCYSGAYSGGVAVRAAEVNALDSFPPQRLGGGRGRAVIAAAGATQAAFEPDSPEPGGQQPSLFTGALVEGLESGEADLDEDGHISLSELYDYVFDKVRERNPGQTPRRQIDMDGELYLARSRRRRIQPAPLPADLAAAVADSNAYTRRGAVSELRSRLNSDNLAAALGAFETLTEMARTDIQHVADLAQAVLLDATIRPSEEKLDFGRVPLGGPRPRRVIRLLGPPIAAECAASTSQEWIRAEKTGDSVEVTVETEQPGALHGRIDLTGPVGAAAVEIDVEIGYMPDQDTPAQDVPSEGVAAVSDDDDDAAEPGAVVSAASGDGEDDEATSAPGDDGGPEHSADSLAAGSAARVYAGFPYSEFVRAVYGQGKKDAIFGSGRSPAATNEPQVTITFEQAINGTTAPVRRQAYGPCSNCKGTGGKLGASQQECLSCSGQGKKSRQPRLLFSTQEARPCKECHGSGSVPNPCQACGGSGQRIERRIIQARIPAGVADGQRIKLPDSDHHFRVRVRPHPLFGLNGTDLTVTVPVTFPELVLGADVTVPALGSPPVTIRIPPGTPDGWTFTVPGHGIRGMDGRSGNLLVTLRVDIPAVVSEEAGRLLTQLAAAMRAGDSARAGLFTYAAAAGSPSAASLAAGVGIDLGTTGSTVAVLSNGEPLVIPSTDGTRRIPSTVSFSASGQVRVGRKAAEAAAGDRTILAVKRRLGTDWSAEIDAYTYSAQEISAFILRKLKRDAESFLGGSVTNAVITVPGYFSDAQRQATREAGQIAGLNVLQIVNEASAAALAYQHQVQHEAGGRSTLLVFRLGGGTFDVSVIEVGGGFVQVKATNGDIQLGGDDWDQRIVDWLIRDFSSRNRGSVARDAATQQRLRQAAEQAKIELSQSAETDISVPDVAWAFGGNRLNLDARLTRGAFHELTSDLLARCEEPFRQVIKDAALSIEAIDQVILVGGATQMPAVVDLVTTLSGGREPMRAPAPDEAAAVGACLAAGALSGEISDPAGLFDVTPLMLGVDGRDGVFRKLIERNNPIPTTKSITYTTSEGNQPSIGVQVYQRGLTSAQSQGLGKCHLTGFAPAHRGVPRVDVIFDMDADGVLNVSAKDLGSEKREIVVTRTDSALSQEEIARMAANVAGALGG